MPKTIFTTNYRKVTVRVTRDARVHCGTYWSLYADYPNEFEAREAAIRAIGEGYAHADLIVTQRFSQGEDA